MSEAATRIAVARTDEFPPGSRRIVMIGERAVGVYRVGDEYFAILNRCPHQFGPLCAGETTGLARTARLQPGKAPELTWERDGEIVRCPWHAWEFDLRTGRAVFGESWKVRTYNVYAEEPPGPVEVFETAVDDSMVYVDVKPRAREPEGAAS